MKNLSLILIISCTFASCATQSESKETPASESSSQPNKRDWLAEFEKGFNNGDAKKVASLYDEKGGWTMANGTHVAAKDLQALLQDAFKQGAGSLVLGEVNRFSLTEGELVRHPFSFKIGEVEISGKRTIWIQNGKIVRDIWVPNTKASEVEHTKVKARLEELDQAYNSDQSQIAAGIYSPDALLVLSTGKTLRENVPSFIAEGVPSVSQMETRLKTVYKLGKYHYASESSFSGKLTLGENIIALNGDNLVLWKVEGENLKIVSEFSWPKKKLKWSEEKIEGLTLKWRTCADRQAPDCRLYVELQSGVSGWIGIGFNTRPELAGSRLFMVHFIDSKIYAEEHLASPPDHAAIADQSAIRGLKGRQKEGRTWISFSLALKNLGHHVTLAWSSSNDLDHHSAHRRLIGIDF